MKNQNLTKSMKVEIVMSFFVLILLMIGCDNSSPDTATLPCPDNNIIVHQPNSASEQNERDTKKIDSVMLLPTPVDEAKEITDNFRNLDIKNREFVYSFAFPIQDLADLLCDSNINLLTLDNLKSQSLLSYLKDMYKEDIYYQEKQNLTPKTQCEFLDEIDYIRFYNGLIQNEKTRNYTPTLVMVGAKSKNGLANDIIPPHGEVYQHTRPCPPFCNDTSNTSNKSPFRVTQWVGKK